MEMLDCMHTFQTFPILEPHDVLDSRGKCLLNIFFDFLARLCGRNSSRRVIFELEFCPDDEMYNVRVNTIRPVIVKNFDILSSKSDMGVLNGLLDLPSY